MSNVKANLQTHFVKAVEDGIEKVAIGNTGPFDVRKVKASVTKMKEMVNAARRTETAESRFVTLGSFSSVPDDEDYNIRVTLLEAMSGINDLFKDSHRDIIGLQFGEDYEVDKTGEGINEKTDQVLTAVLEILNENEAMTGRKSLLYCLL